MEDRINLNIDEENINIHIDETPAFTVEINPVEDVVIELNEQGPAGPRGLRGETGNGIASFELTSSSGLTDTYTITFTDGNTQSIDVENGRGISNITLSNTEGLVDTYTITYNDNTTSTFDVTNGKSAVISGANATINNTVGTPSVNVITSGTPYDRSFIFEFENIKGEQGPQGPRGEQGPVGPQGPEGGTRSGVKGDYCTTYGIEYCQYGLITNPAGTKDITVKGGMMLCIPGADTKTTIGSDINYTIESSSDVTIFYVDGNLLEASKVYFSITEPVETINGYMAWWNPDHGKWRFKSNDTGNVWRDGNATPLADIRIDNDVINRIDYIGYRVLNDDIYAIKSEVDSSISTINNTLGTKANTSLDNLTTQSKQYIKQIGKMSWSQPADNTLTKGFKLCSHTSTTGIDNCTGLFRWTLLSSSSRYYSFDILLCVEKRSTNLQNTSFRILNHYGTDSLYQTALSAITNGLRVLCKVDSSTRILTLELWQLIPNLTYYTIKIEKLSSSTGDYGKADVEPFDFYIKTDTAPSNYSTYSSDGFTELRPTVDYISQDKLTAGDNIKIEDNVISSTGVGLEIGDIGIAPLGIDETKGKRRYLNGQLIIQEQYVQFANKVKSAVALYPSLACTEEEWQTTATITVGGQVGKFVVDDEAGTIRLPKITMPIQGLTDLSKLGEIVEAGLPNIEGRIGGGLSPSASNGAFDGGESYSGNIAQGGGTQDDYVYFNASLSNPIYGNSNTVQQEQIQYPYFIQVATGAEIEDNIINEIELNNPFSLLDYKYSEYELNNLSWLRSNGQYNSKAIYPTVYNLLLKEYNNPDRLATFNKDAFIVAGTLTITEDGVASGFTTNDYLLGNANFDISNTDSWELNGEFTTGADIATAQYPFSLYDVDGDYSIGICIQNSKYYFSISDNEGVLVNSASANPPIIANTKYFYEITYNSAEGYKCYLSQNTENLSLIASSTNTRKMNYGDTSIRIGRTGDFSPRPFLGSKDLKQFSISVDGNKIFSGANSKVKLNTEPFSDYDFVLNTAEETFRLPIKVKLASGKAVVGNGTALGVTDGTNNYSIGSYSTSGGSYERLGAGTTGYGQSLPTTVSSAGTLASNNTLLGITTDSSKSGIETSDSDLYLYFYVGETVQNANLINAGRIEEKLADCLTRNNKEEIVSWGIPDYSAIVNIAISNGQTLTWIAPVDCYVYLQTQSSGSCTAVIFTGDSTTPIDRQDNTNSNGKICSASAFVAKGQEIVLRPVGTVNACYYAPLKGVN